MATTRSGCPVFPWARQGIGVAFCLGLLGALAACTSGGHGQAGAPAQAPGPAPHREAGLVTWDRYAGHVEPDVAIDPSDPRDLLGACQFELGSRTRLPGTFASFDGGRTWTDNGLLPLPAGYEQGADTTVAFDGAGTGFVVALMAHGGGGYASRVSRGGIFLWKTTDGGRSFSKPQPVYTGPGFQDHPWLAVSPAGPASLFITWTNDHGLEFAVSGDGGASFSAPHLLAPGSAPSNPVVTAGYNSVHVFYEKLAGPGQPIRLLVVNSADDGRHFSAPELIGSAPAPPTVGSGPKGNAAMPPPLLGAASDPGTTRSAVAISGQDPRAGHPVIYLWQSPATSGDWQGPADPVTGAGAAVSQVQPRMIYIRHRLYITYFAITRTGEITEQIVHQTASGGYQYQALSDTPFRATTFIGDYQALASSGQSAYALWNDAQSGRLEIVARTFSTRRSIPRGLIRRSCPV